MTVLGLLTLALLSVAAVAAATVWVREPVGSWLLAIFVVAMGIVVASSFSLSLVGWYSRRGLAVAFGVAAIVATAAWLRAGRPRVALRAAAKTVRAALSDRVLLGLAIALTCQVAYAIALGVATAPNDEDTLQYHLARAAFWRQEGAIGYVAGATDFRLDAFAPNGEILSALTLLLTGGERAATLPTVAALVALVVGIAALARRLGLDSRAGLFGALAFGAVPVVALHATTALNDVAVAALVVAAAAFLLGRTTRELALAALAVALALGTKATAVLALPVLVVVALVAWRGRSRTPLAAAAGAALAAGSVWFAVNVVQTGHPLGETPASQRGGADLVEWLGRATRLALETFELPGAAGSGDFLYPLAACVVLVVGGLASYRRRDIGRLALTAGLVALPILLLPVGEVLLRLYQKAWFTLGRGDIGSIDAGRNFTESRALYTWYGPVGLLATVVAGTLAFRAARRRQIDPVAIVLVTAPVVWIGLVGAAIAYFESNGRFAMAGFALAASTWGVLARYRPVAWATLAVTVVTGLLTLAHFEEKPSGIRLLPPGTTATVWGKPRWQVQSSHPETEAVYRFAEEVIPDDARVALWPSAFERATRRQYELSLLFPYPFFGPTLSRHVTYATSPAEAARSGADWAVLPSDRVTESPRGWETRLVTQTGWTILSRATP